MDPTGTRVGSGHLARDAYLYVRQSSLKQVRENTESTRRQYGLRRRALALGWKPEQIVTIDGDQGLSGADSDREGFRSLVSDVSLGKAGIVLGLEVSRLARNNADWHRLIELCGQSGTLILDEEGIYDPADFNDRLLLGIKGTMSEAELHVLRARLLGGQRSKARRGELKIPVPIGFVYDPLDRIVLDPDMGVRRALGLVFDIFERTGSARAVVAHFNACALLFPYRPGKGMAMGELAWQTLRHHRVLQILHNPAYAGAYCYGRRQPRRDGRGKLAVVNVPPSEWVALIHDHHPGYISWDRYERNLRRLRANSRAYGKTSARPPREGPALLQGIAVCGICGDRMTVRYRTRRGRPATVYVCQRQGISRAAAICQSVPGTSLERAIAELLVAEMTPRNANLALQVQAEIQARIEGADALRALTVKRCRDEADMARRRYLKADPDNRLVADVLEADWNQALQNLEAARDEYERRREHDRESFGERQKRRIRDLCGKFPRVFDDPDTPAVDRKRMLRLLIEDVTIVKAGKITLGVRMRGGLLHRIELPRPKSAPELRRTPSEIVAAVDELLERCTDAEIAAELNRRGHVPVTGGLYTRLRVNRIRRTHRLESLYRRLRRKGLLTGGEMAARLGVRPSTVGDWRKRGVLKGCRSDGRGNYLYEWPENPPRPFQRHPKESGTADDQIASDPTREVQYAT